MSWLICETAGGIDAVALPVGPLARESHLSSAAASPKITGITSSGTGRLPSEESMAARSA